jgi:hypothetical protein
VSVEEEADDSTARLRRGLFDFDETPTDIAAVVAEVFKLELLKPKNVDLGALVEALKELLCELLCRVVMVEVFMQRELGD